MIKLYNIFKELIIENKNLITEAISDQELMDAIDSNYRYKIWYQGENEPNAAGVRYVDFYALGRSKAENDVVRVFQGGGFSSTNRPGGWKLLRVDRILKMEKSGHHVGNKSIDKYGGDTPAFNPMGDKSMNSVRYIKKY